MSTGTANARNDSLGTGRRKTSVARVRVRAGSAVITVNERPLDDYFPNEQDRKKVLDPLMLTDRLNQVDVSIKVHGGGITGQSGAAKLGIARALKLFDMGLFDILRTEQPADPRQPHEGTQALRTPRCPPWHAVLEALTELYQRNKRPMNFMGRFFCSCRPVQPAAVAGDS